MHATAAAVAAAAAAAALSISRSIYKRGRLGGGGQVLFIACLLVFF